MRILKKVAALVMVCIMLVSMVPFAAFADHTHTWVYDDKDNHKCSDVSCPDSATEAHTWAKQSDGSYKCTVCNATCTHDSTVTSDWKDGKCNYCGQTCNHKNGTSQGSGSTKHTCSCCGLSIFHGDWIEQGSVHKCGHCAYTENHTWSATTGKCTKCGAQCSHHFDSATGTCTDCGYACKHTADGGLWTFVAKTPAGIEYYQCSKCGYNCGSTAKPHNWKNETGECTVCGAEHSHTFVDGECSVCEYQCLHAKHDEYGVCVKCGKTGISHTFVDGECTVCGYVCPHDNMSKEDQVNHKCDDCGVLKKHVYTNSVAHVCTVCGHQNVIIAHQFNSGGVCSICGLHAVATVKDASTGKTTSYASITEVQAAFNAATDPVVTLLQNVGTDSKNPINYVVEFQNDGTIDLNGNNLQAKVKVIGDLTLKNSSKSTVSKFTRPINYDADHDILLEVEGELTLPTPGTDEKGIELECTQMTAIKTEDLVVAKDNETTIKNSNVGLNITQSVNIDPEAKLSVTGKTNSVIYDGATVAAADADGDAIKGGTYTGTVSNNGKSTRFISGGTFSSVPNNFCITGYGAPTDVKPYTVVKLTLINKKYVNIIVTAGTQKTIGNAPLDLTKAKVNYEVDKLVIDTTKLSTAVEGLTLKDNANLYINVIPIIEVLSYTEPDANGMITVTYDIRLSATAKCGSTKTVDPIECFTWGATDMQVVLPYGIFDDEMKVTHDLGSGSSEEFVPNPTGIQKSLYRDDDTKTANFYVTKFSEFVFSGKGTVVCELTNGKAVVGLSDIKGYYEDISSAVAASSTTDVIKMLADFPNDSDLNGTAKINLDGFDIGALTVETGSITVCDTSDGAQGTVAGGTGTGIGVQVNADATFKLESGNVCKIIKNYGNTTIAGGEVFGSTAIDNASEKSVLSITGGKVEGTTDMAISTVAGSVTSISGDAEIYSENAEAISAFGTLNISGGVIIGDSAIELNAGSTTISGGILIGSGDNTIVCPTSFDALTVSGGQFKSDGTAVGANIRVDQTAMESNVNVSGGVFSAEVKDTHCADDYVPADNKDPDTKAQYPFTVKAKEYAATVTDKDGNLVGGNKGRYETLNEAIRAVPTGGKVTINKDLSENADIYRPGITFELDGAAHTCGNITVTDVNDVYIYGMSKAGNVSAASGNVHIMSGKYGTHKLTTTGAKFIISGYPINEPTDYPYFKDQVFENECYQGWKDSTDELKAQTTDSYIKYVPFTSTLSTTPYTVTGFNPTITSTDPTNRYIYYKSSSTFSPNTVTIATDEVPDMLVRNDKGALRCLKINDNYYDQYGNKYTYNSTTGKWTTSGTSTTPCYDVGTADDGNAFIYVYAAGIVKFFNSTGTKNVQIGFVDGESNVAAFTVGTTIKTGDVNNVMVWIGVAVAAVVVFGGAAYIVLKKGKRNAQ